MILVGKGKRLLELEAKQLILGTTVTIMQFKFIYFGCVLPPCFVISCKLSFQNDH
jgi:hypothetical protein